MTYYIAFHIPTSSFVMCHVSISMSWFERSLTRPITYLLPPGSPHDYDSKSKLLTSTSMYKVKEMIQQEIDSKSLHYNDRVLEEFEIIPLKSDYILPHNRWRENLYG